MVNVDNAARITRSSMKKSEVGAAKKGAKEAEKKQIAETNKKSSRNMHWVPKWKFAR